MRKPKPICFAPDSEAGEWAQTLCGRSILESRITRDKDEVTCPLCLIELDKGERANTDPFWRKIDAAMEIYKEGPKSLEMAE